MRWNESRYVGRGQPEMTRQVRSIQKSRAWRGSSRDHLAVPWELQAVRGVVRPSLDQIVTAFALC
jgi:hypothetical protein